MHGFKFLSFNLVLLVIKVREHKITTSDQKTQTLMRDYIAVTWRIQLTPLLLLPLLSLIPFHHLPMHFLISPTTLGLISFLPRHFTLAPFLHITLLFLFPGVWSKLPLVTGPEFITLDFFKIYFATCFILLHFGDERGIW